MKRALNLFILNNIKFCLFSIKLQTKINVRPFVVHRIFFPATGAIYDDLSDLQNHSPTAGFKNANFLTVLQQLARLHLA